jgi:nitrogen fixation protein
MLSEMGYAHTPPWIQKWQVSPMAHNTVLEAAAQKEGGRALLWHITPGPKLAEAGLPPGNSRFVALLPRAEGEPVVVDIFRMAGDPGQFTWAAHGRTGDLEVRGVDAWSAIEPEAPLRKSREAHSRVGTVEALWKFSGPKGAGLKVLLPALGESSVIASECPPEEEEVKAAHLMGGNPKPGAVMPYRGHLQVKKQGQEAVFVAVYVPFRGTEEPKVDVVASSLAAGAVALRIDIAGERFVVLHAHRPGKLEYDGLTLDGRVGVASWRDDQLLNLALGEGRALSCSGTGIYRSTIGNGFRSEPNMEAR